jgi:GTPase SAR1 family protein
VFKIAVMGTGGVGKSCLALKYIRGSFTDVYDPSIEAWLVMRTEFSPCPFAGRFPPPGYR